MAAAVLINDDKIFVVRRGSGEFINKWEFPGGKIEPGETHKEALRREIFEELQIKIIIDDQLPDIEYDYPDFHLIMHSYICTVEAGDIQILEHNAGKWITIDGIDAIDWQPANQKLIRALKRYLND